MAISVICKKVVLEKNGSVRIKVVIGESIQVVCTISASVFSPGRPPDLLSVETNKTALAGCKETNNYEQE